MFVLAVLAAATASSAAAAVTGFGAAAGFPGIDVSPVYLGLQKRLASADRHACEASWRAAHPSIPASTTSAPAATPTNTPPQGATSFGIACMQAHNQIRAQHNRPPYSYSVPAQQAAQWWANYAWDPRNPHNSQGFGQNVLSGAHNDGCAIAMSYWFNAELPNVRNGATVGQLLWVAGHLTQVLDRRSTQVGCAFGLKTVCNYWPPGNNAGDVFYLN
eukprot:jgi/Hompol1/311/HPOL_005278-RA